MQASQFSNRLSDGNAAVTGNSSWQGQAQGSPRDIPRAAQSLGTLQRHDRAAARARCRTRTLLRSAQPPAPAARPRGCASRAARLHRSAWRPHHASPRPPPPSPVNARGASGCAGGAGGAGHRSAKDPRAHSASAASADAVRAIPPPPLLGAGPPLAAGCVWADGAAAEPPTLGLGLSAGAPRRASPPPPAPATSAPPLRAAGLTRRAGRRDRPPRGPPRPPRGAGAAPPRAAAAGSGRPAAPATAGDARPDPGLRPGPKALPPDAVTRTAPSDARRAGSGSASWAAAAPAGAAGVGVWFGAGLAPPGCLPDAPPALPPRVRGPEPRSGGVPCRARVRLSTMPRTAVKRLSRLRALRAVWARPEARAAWPPTIAL